MTHAMILAAGRGERMRPLTDHCPKPLLAVGGKPLIVWHIEALAAAGIRHIVINTAWLGAQLEAALGDGSRFGVELSWSREDQALETAGGIATALPLLGKAPFLVINGDIFCDYPLAQLRAHCSRLDASATQAHLVLIPYPEHRAGAALTVDAQGRVALAEGAPYTFAGLAAYHPAFFARCRAGEPAALLPLFARASAAGLIQGEVFSGRWVDVGTPERLTALDQALHSGAWQ